MTVAIPSLRVGDPVRHQALTVFPLFSDANGSVDYTLSDHALAAQTLLVEEVSEGGSVPDLLVENKGDTRVLFLEGEELVGAKQNRVLNTSVLVAAHSKVSIPVSCVEQGRWGYNSRRFGSSGSHSPVKLRQALRKSVSKSVKEKRGHQSDQSEVWRQVQCLQSAHGVASETSAMSDVFAQHENSIADYRARLPYVEGATGVAVAIGQRVVAVDLFDKPATCEKVWERLLSGVVFDAIEAGDSAEPAEPSDVEQMIDDINAMVWEPAETVGEGAEYRAESMHGAHGAALTFRDVVVHGSLVADS